jgi:uncharacterized protein involved in response to NO
VLHSYGHYFGSYDLKLYGEHLGVNLIRLLILLIAGRVVPFFTMKRLSHVNIVVPSILKPASMVPLFLLLIPWPESTPRYVFVSLYLSSFCFFLCQLFYWKPLETRKTPILWILHLGLIMVISSLLVDMLALYWNELLVAKASLHLMMAGGLGCISIGMMTRVSLGHTGRFIDADKWMVVAFVSVALGGLVRFLIPVFYPEYYVDSVHHASGWWTLGFLIFLIKFRA